jgi:hypothetical protein
MREPIVVVGLGQMGGTFAHGWLRGGHSIHPVTRAMDPLAVAAEVPAPALVLVATGEAELDPVLAGMPAPWRDRLVLLQNELLPEDWERHGISEPTVAIVWFEKKKVTAVRPILPTRVCGPRAELVRSSLRALDIPAQSIEPDELLFELVRKNLYILTSNIAGLEVGGTVGELAAQHRALAADVAAEVVAVQAWRARRALPFDALFAAMLEAFDADPGHTCTGRSAPARLRRALDHADQAGLSVPTLSRIAAEHG